MELDSPLISFCIPTYNRERYLIKSLESIIFQLDSARKKNLVEILISDNCSTDNTALLAGNYLRSRPDLNIRLISNLTNLGMDGNFLNCYNNALGMYVCLVSDDDFLLPDSVAYILQVLEQNPGIDGIFLNPFPIAGCLPETEGICFNKDNMLELIGNRLIHLGAILFKREIFNKGQYDVYNGTFLVISYIFLDVLRNGQGIQFNLRKFYEITQNNSGGYNFFDVFVTSYCDLLDKAAQLNFSKSSVNKMRTQHLRYFILPFVIDIRLNDSYKRMKRSFKEGFILILNRFGFQPIVLWGVIPALFAPRLFWSGVRVLFRLRRRLIDLLQAGS